MHCSIIADLYLVLFSGVDLDHKQREKQKEENTTYNIFNKYYCNVKFDKIIKYIYVCLILSNRKVKYMSTKNFTYFLPLLFLYLFYFMNDNVYFVYLDMDLLICSYTSIAVLHDM